MESRIRVVIAEDHATVRAAVKALLDREPDIDVVGEADDGEQAVELAKSLVPDVVLMDIAMPNLDGARATRRIKAAMPKIKVLVLSRHDDDGYLKKLLLEGADGYVLKQSSSQVLMTAVRQVAAGKSFLDPTLTKLMLQEMVGPQNSAGTASNVSLTTRESSVLRFTARGYSLKEIAVRLDVSPKTVEAAKSTATQKLGFTSRVEIVRYAIDRGWMEDS